MLATGPTGARHYATTAVPAAREGCRLHACCAIAGNCLDRTSLRATERPRRLLHRRETLYRQDQKCQSLYMVQSGSLKALVTTASGSEHVLGFYLRGDVLGLDGLGSGRYRCTIQALEHTSVCALGLDQLQHLGSGSLKLLTSLLAALGTELNRDHELRVMRNQSRAEHRLSGFLLDWSRRLGSIGYSERELPLPMSRGDIGNYLGMSQETVSRMLSVLRESGVIETWDRYVRILMPERLHEAVETNQAA